MKYKIKIFAILLVSFLFVSLSAYSQNFWQQTNGPFGGNSYGVAQAPNGDLYAAAGHSGIYKSTNGGDTWIKLRWDEIALNFIQAYYIFAASNGYIYASGGGTLYGAGNQTENQGIFRSTDNGNTWVKVENTLKNSVIGFAESSNGYLYTARWRYEGGDPNYRGGVYRSTNNGTNWTFTAIGVPLDDGVTSVAADDSGYVYATQRENTSLYRIYISSNSGATWTAHPTFSANQVVVKKSNRHAFAYRNDGVYRSTNLGTSWTNVSTGIITNFIYRIWVDPSGDVYARTTINQLYRSSDNGNTWNAISVNIQNMSLNNFNPLGNGVIYACVGSRFLYKTTNFGANWFRQENGVVHSDVKDIAVSNSGWIFAIRDTIGLYGSSDNGSNWTFLNTPSNLILDVSADSSNNVFITAGDIYRSTNNGANWSVTINGISGSIAFVTAGYDRNLYAAGMQIYKSTDAGDNWSSMGAPGAYSYLAINSQGHVYALGANAIYKTTNGGTNWQTLTPGYSSLNSIVINPVNNELYISDNNTGFYKSTNGGLNWTSMMSVSGPGRAKLILVYPNGNLIASAFLNSPNGPFYKSTDFGATWVPLTSGWPQRETHSTTSIIGANGYLYSAPWRFTVETQDYIGVWRSATSSNNFTISGQVVYEDNNQPVSSGYVKALKYLNGQVITLDSAVIQSNGNYVLNNVPQDSCDLMAFQNDEDNLEFVPTYYQSTIYWQQSNTLYLTGNLSGINIGVYRIVNGGSDNKHIGGGVFTSNDFNTAGIKDAIIYAKIGNDFKGYSLSNSTGLYQIDSLPQGNYEVICDRMGYIGQTRNEVLGSTNLDSVNFYLDHYVIGIQNQGTEVPDRFNLYQNYPNPFNPVTVFKFDVPRKSLIKLKIFDILGREIAALVNQELDAGSYRVSWNASFYSSGVYFYRIEAGDFIETRKLIVIK